MGSITLSTSLQLTNKMKLFAAFAACASALTLDLPTMMMLQQGMGGAGDMFSNPLLMLSLLESDSSSSSDSTIDDLLPLMMMGGMNLGGAAPVAPMGDLAANPALM